jgi:putative sterol carrier protein
MRGEQPFDIASGMVRVRLLVSPATRGSRLLTREKAAMTKQELVSRMQEGQAWVSGKRVKLDFGSEGVILLDGAASQVTEDDGDADTTIKVNWEDWQAMAAGQLDGMTAFMTGKLRIEGDMSNAMQLQGVLAKLRS